MFRSQNFEHFPWCTSLSTSGVGRQSPIAIVSTAAYFYDKRWPLPAWSHERSVPGLVKHERS